jgi:hypothetical protein
MSLQSFIGFVQIQQDEIIQITYFPQHAESVEFIVAIVLALHNLPLFVFLLPPLAHE